MNKIIEELYDKIDAQDKIINEQALEIAKLKKQLNCKERLTKIMPPDTEFIILSKSDYERQEKDIEEVALELRDRIDKAIDNCKKSIESINQKLQDDKTIKVVDGKVINMNDYQIVRLKAIRMKCKELLEILGDKENE